ncbi:hypothetical protein MEBOL_007515 [Melittangium boletus DSM 14713]|uniref:Uncharacterized protein n=2 Tax=Melittangium boletus TaxID=83453 RepID=A0A250IQK0_9BACT|nr:hypothetical protein MEBOL_007515 [Melittangium boletus DSM 14713]
MLDPTRLLTTVSLSLTAYMALLVAPEPISKGVASAFTLLLWGYLGAEFFDLLQAYVQLHVDAPRASSFEELREVGSRFGQVIGPNSVRILVVVGTAAVGETAALLSKAPKLPGFSHASRQVELSTGLRLADVAANTDKVIISVAEGTIRTVLPATAVAMTTQNGGSGHRAFKSFNIFKKSMGSAGTGKQWHHIVEKRDSNLKRFGPESLHNTENVIPLEAELHTEVSAFYSSNQEFITGSTNMTVRKWLDTQSYEAQRRFGLNTIENIRSGTWRPRR